MLAECPNCHSKISTRSTTCPGCRAPLRAASPDASARTLKWVLVVFNLVMVLWIAFYSVTGRLSLRPPPVASTTREAAAGAIGTPLGGDLGLSFLLGLWLVGCVFLSLATVFAARRSHSVR